MPEFDGPLVPLGWSDQVRARFEGLALPDASPARVSRVERSACVVIGADGADLRVAAAPVPAVGDWVAIWDGAVAGVVPRSSALRRLDPDGETIQVLAANIDLVMITAPADRLSLARIERELVVAWDSGAEPVVVLTKGDVADPALVDELDERLVGVDVVVTSATTGAGVDGLRSLLRPHRSAVMLGPSGAGKSTLINRLLGDDVLATGAVREGDNRGRHTTTRRQLVLVPGGGVLIDTPGLRSLGLPGDGVGLDQAFADIGVLAAQCRFSDCSHHTEPGCAVTEAIREGRLDPVRLASYEKLQDETADRARHVDPRLRKSQLTEAKAMAKSARALGKKRTP